MPFVQRDYWQLTPAEQDALEDEKDALLQEYLAQKAAIEAFYRPKVKTLEDERDAAIDRAFSIYQDFLYGKFPKG